VLLREEEAEGEEKERNTSLLRVVLLRWERFREDADCWLLKEAEGERLAAHLLSPTTDWRR
jgi:hypothetical protein